MMYKRIYRIISFILALTLFAAIAPAAFAGTPVDGIGELLRQQSVNIGRSARLTETTMWHAVSGREEERYIEVSPGSGLTPMVAYGSKLYGTSTLTNVAFNMINNGYPVYAGINADFFSLETGLPLGAVITDGVVRSGDAGALAVGFLPDNTAIIGNPYITTTLTSGEHTIKIDYINKLRQPYSVYLLTPDFSSATRSKTDGLDIVLGGITGDLRIGGTVTAMVEQVLIGHKSIDIPEGKMVISVDLAGPVDRVAALAVGMTVSITVGAADERWAQVKHAAGGGTLLVSGGVADQTLSLTTAPRSAIGVKADGSFIIYVVDGRQSGYSNGISLRHLAQRMASLGCVTAMELDGGGSTAMGARYPGKGEFNVINKPSDGAQRKCANYIFLVNNTAPLGTLDLLHLYPYDQYVLKNSLVQLELFASDANYHAVSPPPAGAALMTVTTTSSITPDGLLTVGNTAGVITAKAQYDRAAGTANFTVLENVTRIEVRNESGGNALAFLSPGLGARIDLKAKATMDGLEVPHQRDECFTWAVTGDIGAIDQSGTYTASNKPGATGTITATYGNITVSLDVTVERTPEFIEGFEGGGAQSLFLQAGGGATYSIEADKQFVRYGKRAARIAYETGTAAPAELSCNIAIPTGATYINMFVFGDGSGNKLNLQVTDAAGAMRTVTACTLDFTGYKRVQAAVSGGVTQLKGLSVTNDANAATSGVIYIDQILAAFAPFDDIAPPSLGVSSLSMDDAGVYHFVATLTDDGRPVSPLTVGFKLNGRDYPFVYNEGTGELRADVSGIEADRLNRLTVTAADATGNLLKHSIDIAARAAVASPFGDTAGHWAEGYAAFLYNEGVVGGAQEGGILLYDSDRALTRAEFAKIITAYLGIDVAQYSNMLTPYADLSAIPSWALDSVKAAYSLGIIRGRAEGSGTYFDPNSTLTRAEIMTILGRTMPKGYPLSAAPFTDSASIPAWARDYISSLHALGVVSGYENGSIGPGGKVTRGEAAKMLYMMY